MNKKINILAIILFMTVLILPSAIWGVKGLTGSKIFESDLGENRELAKWPEFISSNIITEIEAYYNDHAPFRSVLIYGYSVVDTALESTYRKSVQPALVKLTGMKGDGSFGNLA